MIEDDVIIDLFEASDALDKGDESGMRRLLSHIKNRELREEGIPFLFYVADNVKALQFLADNGVDFYQKDKIGGGNLLHEITLNGDESVFEWVLAWFKERSLVDAANDEGISPLSSALKFGKIERARKLIDSGANLSSTAKNGLNPARQAVFCLDGEEAAISSIALLFEKNLILSEIDLKDLARMARDISRPSLAEFIERKLPQSL